MASTPSQMPSSCASSRAQMAQQTRRFLTSEEMDEFGRRYLEMQKYIHTTAIAQVYAEPNKSSAKPPAEAFQRFIALSDMRLLVLCKDIGRVARRRRWAHYGGYGMSLQWEDKIYPGDPARQDLVHRIGALTNAAFTPLVLNLCFEVERRFPYVACDVLAELRVKCDGLQMLTQAHQSEQRARTGVDSGAGSGLGDGNSDTYSVEDLPPPYEVEASRLQEYFVPHTVNIQKQHFIEFTGQLLGPATRVVYGRYYGAWGFLYLASRSLTQAEITRMQLDAPILRFQAHAPYVKTFDSATCHYQHENNRQGAGNGRNSWFVNYMESETPPDYDPLGDEPTDSPAQARSSRDRSQQASKDLNEVRNSNGPGDICTMQGSLAHDAPRQAADVTRRGLQPSPRTKALRRRGFAHITSFMRLLRCDSPKSEDDAEEDKEDGEGVLRKVML